MHFPVPVLRKSDCIALGADTLPDRFPAGNRFLGIWGAMAEQDPGEGILRELEQNVPQRDRVLRGSPNECAKKCFIVGALHIV